MLGNIISAQRKKLGLTQEQLAQKLDVTNQAVSKWETDQSCPDVAMLPKLAELFGISMDELFGKEPAVREAVQDVPWEDDDAFHIVVYQGHRLVDSSALTDEYTVCYEGDAKDIYCALSLSCGDVQGDVKAGSYVECNDVAGNVTSEAYVESNSVAGHVNAGGYVECNDVEGNVRAGAYVECGDVEGSVSAGAYVECGDVGGNLSAGDYVECGDIKGNVTAGGEVDSGRSRSGVRIVIKNKDGEQEKVITFGTDDEAK